MIRYELKQDLISELKDICDNVEDKFSHPSDRAASQGEFPYVTVVWGNWTPEDDGLAYGTQEVDIIAIAYGDEDDLMAKSSQLEDKIIRKLYKNDKIKTYIVEINNSNLFEPFGLNAGVFPPFAGTRIKINIGNVKLT